MLCAGSVARCSALAAADFRPQLTRVTSRVSDGRGPVRLGLATKQLSLNLELAGTSILWGNDARCVIEILGGGDSGLLAILNNVVQRPVGHDQRAYSTNML